MTTMIELPTGALGQHIAILGKTGSGKTAAAKVAIVEPLLTAHRRVGIVDPTSAWWGLRSNRSGTGPGFPVLVLGGDHGDLPLPALGGAAVARLLAEQNVNLVADTSSLTVGERTRWFVDFATTLYRVNRAPLHLVLDEAHNFAPQGKVPDPDTGKMLHAANTLASGGRSRGIRLVMITQRPQKLHKDALTSADTLIAMRVIAPHDREAVRAWIVGCGDERQGKDVLDSLAGLQRGEGWVWYPEGGFLRRLKFPLMRTFDSSATPDDSGGIVRPKGAAEIDLTEIRTALADAVKEADENDPKLLRRKIQALELQLSKRQMPTVERVMVETQETVTLRARLREAERLLRHMYAARSQSSALETEVRLFLDTPTIGKVVVPSERPRASVAGGATDVWTRPTPTPSEMKAAWTGKKVGGYQRMLDALARHRFRELTREELGVQALVHPGGGSFDTYLGRIVAPGYVERVDGGLFRVTEEGLRHADVGRALGVDDLIAAWRRKIGTGNGAGRMFDVLLGVYPATMSRDDLGAQANVSPAGGSFDTYLGRLVGPGLAERAEGGVRLTGALFL